MKITITEWLEQNKRDYGICNLPMDAQTALNFLAEYLEVPPDALPESVEQTNTYIVLQILERYSKKYKKEKKNK